MTVSGAVTIATGWFPVSCHAMLDGERGGQCAVSLSRRPRREACRITCMHTRLEKRELRYTCSMGKIFDMPHLGLSCARRCQRDDWRRSVELITIEGRQTSVRSEKGSSHSRSEACPFRYLDRQVLAVYFHPGGRSTIEAWSCQQDTLAAPLGGPCNRAFGIRAITPVAS